MRSVSISDPQTLNLYSYCGNDPINHVDPEGLFFGSLFKWTGKHLKKILAAVAVVVAVIAVITFPWSAPITIKAMLGLVASLASAASSILDLAGVKTLSKVLGIIAMAAGLATLGFEVKDAWQKLKELRSRALTFTDVVVDGGNLATVTVKISIWEKVVSYAKGFGTAFVSLNIGAWDGISFGYTSQSINNVFPGAIDTNSPAYTVGDYCGSAASLAIPVGALFGGVKVGSWAVKLSRYKHGGGGINLTKDGVRKVAVDFHSFKSKRTGQMVTKIHRHSGKTKSQIRKHKGICSGKEL